jgi:hypothetical protein
LVVLQNGEQLSWECLDLKGLPGFSVVASAQSRSLIGKLVDSR